MTTWPSEDALAAALVLVGIGEPNEVTRAPELGRGALRATVGGAAWIVRLLDEGPFSGARHEQVASAILLGRTPSIVDLSRALGRACVAHRAPAGRPASTLPPAEAALALGQALALLADTRGRTRGTLASPTYGFLPRAARWSTEVREGAARDLATASALGLEFSQAGERLLARLNSAPEGREGNSLAPALDEAVAPVLVHGLLHPARVWVHGGEVCAIIGWDNAGLGDPEQDWAPLLAGPGLAGVREGFGEAAFDERFASPAARDRLLAHVIRFLCRRLAVAAARPRDAEHALGVQRLISLATVVDQPGWLDERLALAANPQPDAISAHRRWALTTAGADPAPERSEDLLSALALLTLAERHASVRAPLIERARQAIVRLDSGLAASPPADSGSFLAHRGCAADSGSLAEALAGPVAALARGDRPHGQALATGWLVDEALRAVADVPSGVRAGLVTHGRALAGLHEALVAALPGGDAREQAQQDLVHGVLALAGLPHAHGDVDAARATVQTTVRRASARLELASLSMHGFAGEGEVAVARLVELPLQGDLRMLPVVLLALERSDLAASVPAQVILRIFGA